MNKLHWNSLALANSYCRKKWEEKPHISDMLRKTLEYFQCNRTGMIPKKHFQITESTNNIVITYPLINSFLVFFCFLSVCSGGGLKREREKKNIFKKKKKKDFWFTLLTWIFVECNNLSIIINGNKKSSKLIKIWFNSDKTIPTFLCLSFTTTASQNSNHYIFILFKCFSLTGK